MAELLPVHDNGTECRMLMRVTNMDRVQDCGYKSAAPMILRSARLSSYIQ